MAQNSIICRSKSKTAIIRLKTSGSKLLFDGYQKVYKDSIDEERDKILPSLAEGERLAAENVSGEQNFTQPPSRYTEASLVKELEEKDIGRPSTYAPIVGTLTERKYVTRQKKVSGAYRAGISGYRPDGGLLQRDRRCEFYGK